MMRIVLDTNVLFDDPVMLRATGTQMLDLLAPAEATLTLSPVVKAELDRRRREHVEDLQATIANRVKRLGRLSGAKSDPQLAEVERMVERAHARWDRRWSEILDHPQVEIANWPRVDIQQVAERELSRRRPFLDKEAGTIGHRDTLIWLGALDLLPDDEDADVIFVTADKGFLDTKGLHPHLLEDLAEIGATERVTHLSSLPALVAALQRATESSGWDAWREPAIAEVAYREVQNLVAEDLVEHWDSRDGGTSAPTFDIGLPFTGHEWVLTYIEGPLDLIVDAAEYGVAELTCSFIVNIGLSGFMEKSDWYAEGHPEVELWDADWNDQLVSIEAERSVRFRARLGIDDANQSVETFTLLDASPSGDAGAFTLG